jgi:hypothetical protein
MRDYQMTWHRLCENRRDAMRLLAAAGFERSEIAELDAIGRAQPVALGVLAGIGCFTRGKGPEPWIWREDDPGDPFDFLKSLSDEEKATLRVDANGSFDEFIVKEQS